MGEYSKMIRITKKKKYLFYYLFSLILLMSCKESNKYPFSQVEMNALPKEELISVSGKIFYIISDSQIGGYIRKAQVFTIENGKHKVYLTIQNGMIKKGDGSVFIDITKYPIEFDSWKIKKSSTNIVFMIYPSRSKKETADPIFIQYNMTKDSFEEKTIDPSEY